ncbi:hypothetical protein FBY35_0444 [Streptomyces sp. SLBN-118]|nr:hypothetical protein FBY35_0444 [Streptomyces sp. SLBN-118]
MPQGPDGLKPSVKAVAVLVAVVVLIILVAVL